MDELTCCDCANKLTLGVVSREMRRRHTARQMVEIMAQMIGWVQRVDGKWRCNLHG